MASRSEARVTVVHERGRVGEAHLHERRRRICTRAVGTDRAGESGECGEAPDHERGLRGNPHPAHPMFSDRRF